MTIFTTGISVNSTMSIQDQLTAAKLDWSVEIVPAIYKTPEGFIESDSTNIAYRSDTMQELSSYGSTRQAYQNRQILETYNEFCNSNGLKVDRLGSLDQGKKIFCLTKLDVEINPVKAVGDITEAYLLLTESHEHGKGTRIDLFTNRLVCTNGMTKKIKELTKSTNHASYYNASRITSNLQLAYNTVEKYEQDLTMLAEVTMSEQEAYMLLVKNYGNATLPESSQPKIVQTALRLFRQDAKGGHLLTAYQTAYGLLQAVTEFTSHHSKQTQTQVSSQLYGSLSMQNDKMYNSLVGMYSTDLKTTTKSTNKQLQSVSGF